MVNTIFCTSGAALAKAGRNVSDSLSGGKVFDGTDFIVDVWIKESESNINAVTRYNWSDNYATLNTDVKYLLQETAAASTAQKCIAYDPSGYTGRAEALLMLNVLDGVIGRNIKLLQEQNVKTFIVEA